MIAKLGRIWVSFADHETHDLQGCDIILCHINDNQFETWRWDKRYPKCDVFVPMYRNEMASILEELPSAVLLEDRLFVLEIDDLDMMMLRLKAE